MLKTLGIVQLPGEAVCGRADSGRLLAGKPLVEWVVRRVTDSQLLDGVIVAAGTCQEDSGVGALVPSDVPVFYGHPTDMLRRLRDAAVEYGTQSLVRVSVENPFIDPSLIDRLVATAAAEPDLEYVGYCFGDGRPAVLSPLGVFAEWMTTRTLRRIERRATDPRDRQTITHYIYTHPTEFLTRLIPVPTELDRDDVRLTVDSQEDWERAQDILEALGPEHLDWQGIAGFLHHQPALRQRMAILNRGAARV